MKKYFLLMLSLLCLNFITVDARTAKTGKRWFEKDPRIEVVNETTVIFNNVLKIEIRTNCANQVTYVYDIKHSRLMKVARGSFEVDLPRGNYLVQSDKRITKTIYEVVIE